MLTTPRMPVNPIPVKIPIPQFANAMAALAACFAISTARCAPANQSVELGRRVFADVALSRDGKVSCQSCHEAAHGYSDSHSQAIGVDGKVGTRNAPSLIGIAKDGAYFWDGRRSRLENAVVDPFTNPVELGLSSQEEVVRRLRSDPIMVVAFNAVYPNAPITFAHVQEALARFVRAQTSGTSAYDRAHSGGPPLTPQARLGETLFTGVAGCSTCHALDGTPPRFSDGQYHHSGINPAPSERLSALAQAVVRENRGIASLGPKVLTDSDWSALGRFIVSHNPADIGAFRTPSLRNVAITAPYMHDGSIATLREAVDHEVYYRGFSTGHPINLTEEERQALVAFLESLTDEGYAQSGRSPRLAK